MTDTSAHKRQLANETDAAPPAVVYHHDLRGHAAILRTLQRQIRPPADASREDRNPEDEKLRWSLRRAIVLLSTFNVVMWLGIILFAW